VRDLVFELVETMPAGDIDGAARRHVRAATAAQGA
jgi:hypothetical protein